VKDGPKRRRETSTSLRARAASTSSTYAAVANVSVPSTQSSSDTSAVHTPTTSADIIKIEEAKSTPYSTPQMSQTPLSTPHMGALSGLPSVVDEQPLDHNQQHLDAHSNLHAGLPGLNIDTNGVKTINPLDSFASMI
jgi:hypothetical protein